MYLSINSISRWWVKVFYWTPGHAGRVLWNRVCPSVLLSKSFLGIWSLVFPNFWHGDRKPCEVVGDKARFFKKILIALKIGKKGPKWAKKWGFFHVSQNFVISFGWKWSRMKDHIVIGFLVQTPCLPKFWFLKYGPKSSWPIRLQYFKMAISQGQNDELG